MDETKRVPIVSVVIPTYNRAAYLREAIDSVLAQTFQDFELIVVDDGSTDETPQVLAEVHDPRVQYIRLPGNCGPAMARNVGICHAAGELIAFLDDDDAYYPELLARVVDVMGSGGIEVGFCWCGIRLFRETLDEPNAIREVLKLVPSYRTREQAFRSFWGGHQPGSGYGLTARKACFANVGLFDATLRRSQDTDLVLRLAKVYDYVAIPEVLVKVREHGGSCRTKQTAARAYALDRIYAKHAASLKAYPRLRALWLARAGSYHYQSGRRWLARWRILQALAIAPWRVQTWRTWGALELYYRHRLPNDRGSRA